MTCSGIDVTPDKDTLIGDVTKLFARKTSKLLQNKKLQGKIGNNGHETVVRNHKWEIYAECSEQIYNEAILASRKYK